MDRRPNFREILSLMEKAFPITTMLTPELSTVVEVDEGVYGEQKAIEMAEIPDGSNLSVNSIQSYKIDSGIYSGQNTARSTSESVSSGVSYEIPS